MNSSFLSLNWQSVDGAAMLPTEMDQILKKMKELEAQNGEFYRQQNLRQFDEPVIAKYLNELHKLVEAAFFVTNFSQF